jgi:hypothetical protein
MLPYCNSTRRTMEDNLNILENERRPQFFFKERRPRYFEDGRRKKKVMKPKTVKNKNNNIFENGRQPQFALKKEGHLNCLENNAAKKH